MIIALFDEMFETALGTKGGKTKEDINEKACIP
jgi:hypothetical protein